MSDSPPISWGIGIWNTVQHTVVARCGGTASDTMGLGTRGRILTIMMVHSRVEGERARRAGLHTFHMVAGIF